MPDYTLQVTNNQQTNYRPQLVNHPSECCSSNWKTARPFRLWQVALWNPMVGCWLAPIFVLAPDRSAAVGQATCKTKLSSYNTPYKHEDYVREVEDKARCEQVPYLVPGFGDSEF